MSQASGTLTPQNPWILQNRASRDATVVDPGHHTGVLTRSESRPL